MNGQSAKAILLKTGPGSSIQDMGRMGFAQFGVPSSGAMDQRSFRWVNHLLQNDENDAVLEISQPGFAIRFNSPTQIALAGAIAHMKLKGREIQRTGIISIRSGDILEIGTFHLGARIYLGISRGFQSQSVLGSKSFYKGLTEISQLSTGAELSYIPNPTPVTGHNAAARWSPDWYAKEILTAYPGPDFCLLDLQTREKIVSESFTVSNFGNRMGIQLLELLPNQVPEIATNPIFPGMVQLTSGGKLLVLLRDAQVTGGYPRILLLDEESQWSISQKKPAEQIRFRLSSTSDKAI
ncbi:biotin-dependent carboxyltransferase family protein [Algoriphagus aestuariicola]|uniref:Biotin-dependent carboxyltransferase family protein n=1 Tax=Algoriphagus aestuariicola TaxID=1852016 RepID=A0ABS3BQL1_9BACT|nr:biotin-dependent carboxyltransferase family protein [Algoriphagus aestuariicola]MBN7799964.1 biotin-dependent carboxyltransferase family protein [Algoriphagus aestuariicola]